MESQSPRGATGKLASLVVSVMDLHVRIALKEVDREKRRLIVGALLMGTALVLLTGALLVAHAALVIVLVEGAALDWLTAFLVALPGPAPVLWHAKVKPSPMVGFGCASCSSIATTAFSTSLVTASRGSGSQRIAKGRLSGLPNGSVQLASSGC